METQDKEKRKEGKKILENYKKQLNDKIQRERKEREKMKAQNIEASASQLEQMDFMDKRMAAYESSSIPDPRDLQEILEGKFLRNNWPSMTEIFGKTESPE